MQIREDEVTESVCILDVINDENFSLGIIFFNCQIIRISAVLVAE
jgi:hypothetical protein